jgi:dTDP-4-amino-4,6-dideoxygalactose transaminase
VHYEHSEVGFNYRMNNLLAAIGRAQLVTLPQKVARRREIRTRYERAFSHQPGIQFLPEAPYGRTNAWLTCIRIDAQSFGATGEDIRLHLESQNIETRPVWKPMHLQPVFQHCRVRGGSVAAELFANGLCLPSGSGMSDAEQDRVIAAFESVPRHARARVIRAKPEKKVRVA